MLHIITVAVYTIHPISYPFNSLPKDFVACIGAELFQRALCYLKATIPIAKHQAIKYFCDVDGFPHHRRIRSCSISSLPPQFIFPSTAPSSSSNSSYQQEDLMFRDHPNSGGNGRISSGGNGRSSSGGNGRISSVNINQDLGSGKWDA